MHRYLNADALEAIMEHEKIAETETRPCVSTKPLRNRGLQNRTRTKAIALSDTLCKRRNADGTETFLGMIEATNVTRTRKRAAKSTTVADNAPHRTTAADMAPVGQWA